MTADCHHQKLKVPLFGIRPYLVIASGLFWRPHALA